MSGEQDDLVFELGVAAGENPDHVPGVPLPGAATEVDRGGDVLNEVAVVAERGDSNLAEFGGEISCRAQFVGRTAAAALHGVTGEGAEFVGDLSGRSVRRLGLLSEQGGGEREQRNADGGDDDSGAIHICSGTGSSIRLPKIIVRDVSTSSPKLPPATRGQLEPGLPSGLESLRYGFGATGDRAVGSGSAELSRSAHDGERVSIHECGAPRRRSYHDSGFDQCSIPRLVRAGITGERLHDLRQSRAAHGSDWRE